MLTGADNVITFFQVLIALGSVALLLGLGVVVRDLVCLSGRLLLPEPCHAGEPGRARLSGPGGFGRLPREPKQLQCWGCPPPHTRAHKRPRRHDRLLTHRRGE